MQTLAERLQQVLQALAPVQQNEVARLLRQRTPACIHAAGTGAAIGSLGAALVASPGSAKPTEKVVERTLAQTTDAAVASAVDISVDAKREIVLASAPSLEATAKLLERVDQLKDAARAPDASALRRASATIDAVQAGHAAQVAEAEWVDAEYAAMLEAYNTNVRGRLCRHVATGSGRWLTTARPPRGRPGPRYR